MRAILQDLWRKNEENQSEIVKLQRKEAESQAEIARGLIEIARLRYEYDKSTGENCRLRKENNEHQGEISRLRQENEACIALLEHENDEKVAAAVEKKTREILSQIELSKPSCPVCLENFATGARQPYALSCEHMICANCLLSVQLSGSIF